MNNVINIKIKNDLTATSQMTPELENLLGKIEYDIARGKNISKSVFSPEEINEKLWE